MVRRTRVRSLVLVATVLAMDLTACTSVSVLDDARLESEIQTGFQAQTGVQVQSVECPDEQPLLAGATFDCALTTAEGETVGIRVTQTDGQSNVRWEVMQ